MFASNLHFVIRYCDMLKEICKKFQTHFVIKGKN